MSATGGDLRKDELVAHDGDGPYNAEPPPHLLDDAITPLSRLFVRNNGRWPERPAGDPDGWTLTVDGVVERPLTLTLHDLRTRFETVRLTTVIECAGNGRSRFRPPTDGLPWGLGAIGCIEAEGVRLRDVLEASGPLPSAVYVGHVSPDRTWDGQREAISRGLPIAKALAGETLLAFRMNGEDLPFMHGGPLRVVAPGFPGSAWQKWLSRLWVRDREHDGARMTGLDYRLPNRPLAPGEEPDPADFSVIEAMPVRSLITSLAAGATVRRGETIVIGGWAHAGPHGVSRVDVSVDAGATWMPAQLAEPASRWAWARFSCPWRPMAAGHAILMARAVDARGVSQPLRPDNWNPKGYCCNACHDVAVTVAD